MADFLAPKTSGGAAAFEQPVQRPSGVAAFAGLASNLLGTVKSAPSLTEDEKFGQAWLKFQEDEGLAFDPSNPAHLQSRLVKFISGHPQFTSQATSLGEAAGLELITPEARQLTFEQELVSSEAYQAQFSLLQLTRPELTETEMHQGALTAVTAKMATDARITNSQISKDNTWLDIEGAYVDRAVDLTDTFRAVVASIEEDQVITPEEASAVRDLYNSQLGALDKPAGIPDEEWKAFQDSYVKPIGTILDGVVNLKGTLNSDMKGALDQILAKAVSQGKLPPALLIKFQEGTDGSYTSLTNLLNQFDFKEGSPFIDNYKSALNMNFDELLDWVTEFEFKGSEYLDSVDLSEFNSLGGERKATSLLTDARNMSSDAAPEQLALDIINVVEKTNSLDKTTLAPNDFNRIFSKGFFNSLVKVNDVNPEIGTELAGRTREAISKQLATVTTAIQNQANTSGFTINPDGSVSAIPERMTVTMQRAVEEHWGGDWDQAFKDGGRTPTGFTLSEFSVHSKLFKELERGSKYITTLRGSLSTLQDVMPQVFEAPEEALVAPEDVSQSFGAMQSLADSFEGQGDYDTLWSGSQRDGGAFSGVRVSEMTIGEIKEFASPSGRYGRYVQRTNPKGDLATPMGRYQFVGTTLKEVAKQMGLSDRTVFSPEVQDAMFAHRIKWRLDKANTVEGKLKQLRLEWDGFNRVDDRDLVRAIEAFEKGTPIERTTLGDAVTTVSQAPVRRPSANTSTSMSTPVQRPQVLQFSSEEEVDAAMQTGDVKVGDIIVLNGQAMRVEADG